MSELLEIEDVWYQRLYSSVEKVYTTEREFQSLVHRLVWQLGPLILEERTNLLNEQINEYKGRLLRQIHQMKKSENPEIMPKIKEVSFMVDLVEGLRKWQ